MDRAPLRDSAPAPRLVLLAPAPDRRFETIAFATAGLAVAVGILVRAWFLFHHPSTSDEAVTGLIAQQILHGHTYAFFWGQPFGGVEPYVVAAFFGVLGSGTLALTLAPACLSAAAALLVWRVARRLVTDRALAALAGALAFAAPLAADYTTTIEGGYRGVTLLCGLGTLLFALRIHDGRREYSDLLALGLFAGVGWWSLPEIAYLGLPASLVVVLAVLRAPRPRLATWAPRLAAAAVAFALGALPWIWADVGSGLASLDPGRFPGTHTPLDPGYLGRLRIIFEDALPLQLNLRRVGSGGVLFGATGTVTLERLLFTVLAVAAVSVAALAVGACLLGDARARALGLGLVAYPFLVALQPGTWYWVDGRYTVYTGTLLALAVVVGAEMLASPRGDRGSSQPSRARAVAVAVVLVAVVVTLADLHQSFGVGPGTYATGWGDPDRPAVTTAAALARQGVQTGYANYWIAYKTDLLSEGRVTLGVTAPDPVRSGAIQRRVERSGRPSWIFVPPAEVSRARAQFGDVAGPGGVSERAFLASLRQQRIPYRVLDAGLVQAVVPARPPRPPAPAG